MTTQAIIRTSYTVAATFTGVPTIEERKALKASGAEYRNGQWVRTISGEQGGRRCRRGSRLSQLRETG